MRNIKSFFLILTLIALILPAFAYAREADVKAEARVAEREIKAGQEVVWEGNIRVDTQVVVQPGGKLIVKDNAKVIFNTNSNIKVLGVFQAMGTMGKEIVFDVSEEKKKKGEVFGGIAILNDTSNESFIKNCIIRNASNGITCNKSSPAIENNVIENSNIAIELIQEAFPRIENSLIKKAQFGIKVQLKSLPLIKNNYFKEIENTAIIISQGSQGRVINNTISSSMIGISVQQGVVAEISGNTITGAKLGVSLYQVSPETIISANHISYCEKAVSGESFAEMQIIGNYIERNSTGISLNQFSHALIKNNDIVGNSTGIIIVKKSNPSIEKNNVSDNDIGVFCDYSAYPTVTKNNIYDNKLSVKLGDFQSAEWERGEGATDIIKEQASSKQSKAKFNDAELKSFADFVDFRENYWGETVIKEMNDKGSDKNISVIYDFFDKKEKMKYPGFEGKEYALDKVNYDNWSKITIPDSGRKETLNDTKNNPKDISQ